MNTARALAAAALATASTAALAQLTPNWTHPTGRITMGSPRLADLDGDGAAEIILGTMGFVGNPYAGGALHALDLDGAPLPGFPIEIGSPIVAPPAIGDIDGDGAPEIVATSWGFLWAWDADGSEVPGFPISTGVLSGIPPALADLTGDGALEIIAAHGSALYVYTGAGATLPGWPVFASSNFQAPGAGDIDGDGILEIVAGTWAPQFPDLVPHELHVYKPDGSAAPGFPVGGLGSIRGPVSMGDADGDGSIEIVTRSGDQVYIFTSDGEVLPGWPKSTGGPTRNADTAIGDLDGDGDLEIIIGGYDVYAFHHTGARVEGWPAPTIATGNIRSSAVIADIDSERPGLESLLKISSHMIGLAADGAELPWSPYFADDQSQSTTFDPSPAIGDAVGDGRVAIVYVSTPGEIHFFTLTEPFDPARAPWPTAQQNNRNTCFLPPAGDTCYADCDDSGALDFFDFLCFQDAFSAGDPYADCDDSGGLDFFDFLCFQNAFSAGCP